MKGEQKWEALWVERIKVGLAGLGLSLNSGVTHSVLCIVGLGTYWPTIGQAHYTRELGPRLHTAYYLVGVEVSSRMFNLMLPESAHSSYRRADAGEVR